MSGTARMEPPPPKRPRVKPTRLPEKAPSRYCRGSRSIVFFQSEGGSVQAAGAPARAAVAEDRAVRFRLGLFEPDELPFRQPSGDRNVESLEAEPSGNLGDLGKRRLAGVFVVRAGTDNGL